MTEFLGTWQTIAGCTIHYNENEARLYRGIHRQAERDDGSTYLDGSHLEYVDTFANLRAAQDAAVDLAQQKGNKDDF